MNIIIEEIVENVVIQVDETLDDITIEVQEVSEQIIIEVQEIVTDIVIQVNEQVTDITIEVEEIVNDIIIEVDEIINEVLPTWFDYIVSKTSFINIPITGGKVQEYSYFGTPEKKYRFIGNPYNKATDIIYTTFSGGVLSNPIAYRLITL